MTSPIREKIIISSRTHDAQNPDKAQNPPPISKNWRVTNVGFTTLGGLLAFACLTIIVMAPTILSNFFRNRSVLILLIKMPRSHRIFT
jgi:hypothetical protein